MATFWRRNWLKIILGGSSFALLAWFLWSKKSGKRRRASISSLPPPNPVDTGFIPIGEAEKREADDELKHKFLEAANLARSGSVSIASNEVQLQLYGLYKQATIGVAVPTDLGFWDVVGKAKWEAWNKCGSMTKQEAMTKYVELVESLAGSSGGEKAGKQENKGWKSTSKMAEPDSPEKEETKDFLFHCREGNIAEAVKMIQHSADVLLLKDEEGVSGLLWACDRGHTELVLELLNAGADLEQRDLAGLTPLHYAALNNREELVRVLLSRGANVGATDNDGTLPKQLADVPSVVALLEEAAQ